MTQRNGTIAGTCHNDIKTKTVIVLKRTKRWNIKSKNQDIIIFVLENATLIKIKNMNIILADC